MANANKHRERSHRSYRQKEANLQGFQRITYAKAQQKKYARENKSIFARLLGRFKNQ